MGLHKKFFEAQTPPPVDIFSIDNIDWYNEMVDRCFLGYSYRGTRITGDHFFFLNFFPIMRVLMDSKGNPTKHFDLEFPFYSQEDDYLMKQMEEAEQDDKAIFLFTGRGFGKTYMVVSIAGKIYYLVPKSHSVISGSLDDHAAETFSKLKTGMTGLEKIHPTLFYNRLTDNTELIRSGYYEYVDGKKQEAGMLSQVEKIIYSDKPGKSKGRRLNFQQFEEAGDWSGPAPLKECISASEGTWKVGSIVKCRVFYTGTGGTVKSKQAKDIFFNPEAYNLYTVREWKNRPTGIVVPSYRKLGGFWEKTGISDVEGAKAYLESERERKREDPIAYTKHIQEFPFNPDEMFMLSGVNNFDQAKVADQFTKVTTMFRYKRGTYGKLEWVPDEKGKRIGVNWVDDPNGKLWKLEDPELDEDGKVYPHLYIAGYDGIDLGTQDTESGIGSKGATAVKKRLLSTNKTNNLYVMFYVDRPVDIDELYETNLMISWYYNCLFNIEDTKRGIVPYWKNLGEFNRFMKRPRLTLSDPTVEFNNSNLIGVTNAPKNYQYGEEFLIRYVKHYCDHIFFADALEQLRDFTMENRTEFDIIVAMMMAELGDDELMDKHIIPEKPNYDVVEEGYYTDENNVRRWGILPNKIDPMNFPSADFSNYIDYIDLANRESKYN
jgi:hypothetical protein